MKTNKEFDGNFMVYLRPLGEEQLNELKLESLRKLALEHFHKCFGDKLDWDEKLLLEEVQHHYRRHELIDFILDYV